ncbi:hypothetical protein CU633_02345 [Bacillus sp. V3-13]|uniref:hypothetical protein n=1 Tax=Bacillus sp. V3-13 TaxID=2053728 RepID=UPI000C76CAC8|nr:hypothetical protein [Bacillus sp. V3-13]PLR79046.1 hypothetical protein CU633_02345 [Bacillus sp. V3-13]
MTELVRIAILVILCTQGGYFLAILVLSRTMIEWYEWSILPNPNNHWFPKIINGFTATFMGIAYWAGKRVDHHNFLLKRIYLLGYALIYAIAAMIVYDILDYLLRVIERIT